MHQSLDPLEQAFGIDKHSVLVSIFVGTETAGHSSSKGFVFVHDPETGTDSYLNSKCARQLQRTNEDIDRVDETGRGWIKGHWTRSLYAVPEGTILKLFFTSTLQGGSSGGSVYVVTKSSVAEIILVGRGVSGRNRATLQGRMEVIPCEQFSKYDISIPEEYLRQYLPHNAPERIVVTPARNKLTRQVTHGRRISFR